MPEEKTTTIPTSLATEIGLDKIQEYLNRAEARRNIATLSAKNKELQAAIKEMAEGQQDKENK